MTRLLFLLFFGFLLAGCDSDFVKFEGAWHKFNKIDDSTREAGDYENFAKEIQQLAAKGYAPGLSASIFLYRIGHFPKNSKLIEANIVRLNELGYLDAKEELAYLYGAGSGVQPPDANKAIHWHEQYLIVGWGLGGLASLYLDGVLIPPDLDKAESVLAKQIDRASFTSLELYGNLLLERGGDSLSEAYMTFKVLEQLSLDRLDGGETLPLWKVSETEKLEISEKASDWHRKIINSGYEGSRLWISHISGSRQGFPKLGSVTQLEHQLREQAAFGAPEYQFLLARYLFSEYAGFDEPRMVEALHFAEKAAAKDYLPAVSLVAEIHLSKPNLSKAESGQYMAEMVSALEKGYVDRAEYLRRHANVQFTKYGDRQGLIIGRALSILEAKLRKDHYSAVLAVLDNQLTATEIDNALNLADSYEFSPAPDYSNRPDTWPSIARVCFGIAGIIVCGFVFYLGWLVYRARLADRSKNVFAAMALCSDSYIILVFLLVWTLPSSTLAQEIAQGLAQFLPLAGLGSIMGRYGLACQFETRFSRFLNVKIVKYGLACFVVCFVAYVTIDPLRASEGYAWDSWQPPFKVLQGFNGGLAMNTGSLRLISMVFLWLASNVIFFTATIVGLYSPLANNRSELIYYLKAYGAFTMALMPLFIALLFGKMGIWGYWYVLAFPPSLYFSLAILVFAVFFSLGILRNQVFGIERVFRKNTVRAVLGGIGLASFFLAENIVGNLVEEDYGTLGGIIAALSILGLQNRLMFIVKPMVNSLFSDEMDQSFSDQMTTYLQVYRMATLDGIITEQEQTMLTATADGLNLNSDEIEAVEDFVKLEKGNRQV
jgi:TPR repeat protein